MLQFIAIAIPEQHIAVAIATVGKLVFKPVSVAIETKCYDSLQLQLSPSKVSTMVIHCFNCNKYTRGKIEYGISNIEKCRISVENSLMKERGMAGTSSKPCISEAAEHCA